MELHYSLKPERAFFFARFASVMGVPCGGRSLAFSVYVVVLCKHFQQGLGFVTLLVYAPQSCLQ